MSLTSLNTFAKKLKCFAFMLHIIKTHIGLYIHNYIKCVTMLTDFLQKMCQTITLLHIFDRLGGSTTFVQLHL